MKLRKLLRWMATAAVSGNWELRVDWGVSTPHQNMVAICEELCIVTPVGKCITICGKGALLIAAELIDHHHRRRVDHRLWVLVFYSAFRLHLHLMLRATAGVKEWEHGEGNKCFMRIIPFRSRTY